MGAPLCRFKHINSALLGAVLPPALGCTPCPSRALPSFRRVYNGHGLSPNGLSCEFTECLRHGTGDGTAVVEEKGCPEGDRGRVKVVQVTAPSRAAKIAMPGGKEWN
jgi:hypothetical protein